MCSFMIGSCGSVDEKFFDHFTTRHPRWNWDYSAGTGYQTCPTSIDGLPDTICEIGTTGETNGQEYSDCALYEHLTGHNEPDVFETRLKCSGIKELGTRGWGFFAGTPESPYTVCFGYAGPNSSEEYRGFRAMIFLDGEFVYSPSITGYNMDKWHTYRIERYKNGAEFFIDNTSVAKYSGSMPDKSMIIDIWTDNFVVKTGIKLSYVKITQNQKIFIDWVSWRQLK